MEGIIKKMGNWDEIRGFPNPSKAQIQKLHISTMVFGYFFYPYPTETTISCMLYFSEIFTLRP